MTRRSLVHRWGLAGLRGLVRAYQLSFRIVLGPRCRYLPTCSDYALEALEVHGLWTGGRMTVSRLCRCRPGGGSGYDPVLLVGQTRDDR